MSNKTYKLVHFYLFFVFYVETDFFSEFQKNYSIIVISRSIQHLIYINFIAVHIDYLKNLD